MKREELEKLGLSKEQIDSVMGLHGADIETHKQTITSLTTERDTVKAQLTDANKQIESFKGMKKPEEVDAAINEWKVKLSDAEKAAADNLTKVKFDHALESALTVAKAKNVKAVQALLNAEKLKLKDDGTIEGLEDQLKEIKTTNDYLFSDTKEPPRIVTGGNNQTVLTDAFEAAMWKGAGIKPPEGK